MVELKPHDHPQRPDNNPTRPMELVMTVTNELLEKAAIYIDQQVRLFLPNGPTPLSVVADVDASSTGDAIHFRVILEGSYSRLDPGTLIALDRIIGPYLERIGLDPHIPVSYTYASSIPGYVQLIFPPRERAQP